MKKNVIFLVSVFLFSAGIASADMNFTTHSPMYNTMFGTGVGGFSATHNVGAGVDSAQAVQATAEEWADKDNVKSKESSVTFKNASSDENKFVPAASLGGGEGYSYEKGEDGYVYGYANGGAQGVNETKTIYTDGIGRLHFFGKGSSVKE